MKYTQIIKSILVYPEGGPWFHELATEVCLDDESAGHFIVLKQCPDDPERGQVRIEPEELDLIYSAAKQLLTQHNNDNLPTYTGELKQTKCFKAV